ncbi:protein rep [Muricauda sp. ANG21]|uniref:protein rep n=1 Tax=Allomuricauda sp. ANG21 TaxID=3042468 RepID=UPI00345163F9
MIDIAKAEEDREREKAYWNTYHCQSNLVSSNGKLYGNYCKNRYCTICLSIRKAEIINKYYPVIANWDDPHFVTITVKSCKEHQLRAYFKSIKTTFTKIVNKHKKREQRGTGEKLIGIKSMEANFNPNKKTYNPHFHILVANKNMAEIIVKEWGMRAKPNKVSLRGQKIKKVWDLERNLIEIIKYGSKIFTEPHIKTKAKETDSHIIYAKGLDTIFKAMKGQRIFDRFGFNLPPELEESKPSQKILTNFKQWEYDSELADWVNVNSLEKLADYKPPSHLIALLENNINKTLS